jgi:hypothetical protein
LEQHPVGQLAALQTQAPPTHRWPVAHAAAAPHLQVPLAQSSARFESQAAQVAPAAPHCWAVGVMHWLLAQQPSVQLVASQTQAPPLQRRPAAQAGPPPQVHAPAVQVSVACPRHDEQTAPAIPQALSPGTWQTPSKQQPLGQLRGLQPLQVPLVHAPPPGQLWQARPPLPHLSDAPPSAQKSPSQQPPQVLGPQVEVAPPPAPPAVPPSPPPAAPPPAPPPPTPPPPPPLPSGEQKPSTQRLPEMQSAVVVQA